MSILSILAVYLVLWWLVLFAVLPWGVRTQEEQGEVVPGSNPSSPVRPMLVRKLVATTVIAGLLLLVLYWVVVYGNLSLDDIPFLPDFSRPI